MERRRTILKKLLWPGWGWVILAVSLSAIALFLAFGTQLRDTPFAYAAYCLPMVELQLRVRALLRRTNIEMDRKITVGNLVLDADAMTAEVDGEEPPTTTREFNILYQQSRKRQYIHRENTGIERGQVR